jgi:dTDP-4-dehydrorhamnose reductase
VSGFERVLVTGGGGQLASDLEALLAGECEFQARSHAELDIADASALARAFAETRPDVVFNCAAFHNVEVCEREEQQSFAVNATAVKRMAELCDEHGARLVHLSTNYVFDGTAEAPYAEEDAPSPQSIYALSKLAGEHTALTYAPGALVVRTGGLYGRFGSASKGGNFVTRMIDRAREQGELAVVADQRLSPTATANLASAVIEAVNERASGLLHLTASGSCSWHEFTEAIMELAGIEVEVRPTATERQPGAARRPLNGVLSRPRADALGLTPLPHWRQQLQDYMEVAGLLAQEPLSTHTG